MFRAWLISSLYGAVYARRFETAKSLVEETNLSPLVPRPVDCSHLKPPPKWMKSWEERKGGELFFVTNVPVSECEDYFAYFGRAHVFVAMQQVHQETNGEKLSFCALGDYLGKSNFCEDQKAEHILKYTAEWVPELCKARLCDYATTGRWRDAGHWRSATVFSVRRNYRTWLGKKMPWKRTVKSFKSIGYEEVFRNCRTDEPIYTDYKLPELDVFAQRYGLINPSGTFNKTVCGCATPDSCA